MKRRPAKDVAGALPPRKRRRRGVEAVLFAIGCLLLTDALIGEHGVVATRRARAAQARQVEELQAAEAETDRLKEELRRLTDDPATIEDAARRDLGLMKPGEKIFVLRELAPGTAH